MVEEVALSLDAGPQAVAPDAIDLVAINLHDRRRLAAPEDVDTGAMAVAQGARPPAHVAAQTLARLGAGTPALWCRPFLMVAKPRDVVRGGRRFKSAPVDGRVEIGCGVAPGERGRGIATAAVRRVLALVAASGVVRQVVAHILPGNAASSRVVARLGFTAGPTLVDHDGEVVVPWIHPIANDIQREQHDCP